MLDRRPAHSSLTPMRRTTRRSGLRAHLAGVAQPAEHLFCKQAVGGSTPPVSSTSFDTTSEGCPSGQREQAVNLPDFSYVGSNPTPSTSFGVLAAPQVARPSCLVNRARRPRRLLSGAAATGASIDLFFQDRVGRRGGAVAPQAAYRRRQPEVVPSEQAPIEGTLPAARTRRSNDALGLGRTDRSEQRRPRAPSQTGETGGACSSSATDARPAGRPERQNKKTEAGAPCLKLAMAARPPGPPNRQHKNSAGVAQLVEHQPSKLNVVGSSPISRSTSRAARRDLWAGRFVSFVAGAAEARTGAERTSVREHRTGAEAQPPAKIADRRSGRHEATSAHIAQLAERVLGKDEVTSSNLVVGSAALVHRGHSPRPVRASRPGPHPRFWGPNPKTNFSVSRANPPHQEGSLE
jgi:hypothetical protein